MLTELMIPLAPITIVTSAVPSQLLSIATRGYLLYLAAAMRMALSYSFSVPNSAWAPGCGSVLATGPGAVVALAGGATGAAGGAAGADCGGATGAGFDGAFGSALAIGLGLGGGAARGGAGGSTCGFGGSACGTAASAFGGEG